MKNKPNQLLRDLNAAILLGNPEAVDLALNGLLALPGVAANDRMDEAFIRKVILPVGQALNPLSTSQLRPLLKNSLAAGRAVGAVALAHQFVRGGQHATEKDLRHPASDPRADVRGALGQALFSGANRAPEKVFSLGADWLANPAPKLRHTALLFLPALSETHGARVVELLAPLSADEDFEVRKSLVEALTNLGRGGLAESVLGLLEQWAATAHPNSWVICRTLSASWVTEYPQTVETILRAVKSHSRGESSEISSALKALERHGLTIQL